jgi:hypothetical protein
MRCAVIARHRGEYPVRLMCRVLQVSVAGFSAYRRWPESWRAVMDDVLMAQVRDAFSASGGTYCAPRIERELRAEGLATSRKRVARIDASGGAGRPADAASARGDHGFPACRPHRPQSAAAVVRPCGGGGESRLGRRPHLPAHARGIPEPGGGAGPERPPVCGLGDARPPGGGLGTQRLAHDPRGPPPRA